MPTVPPFADADAYAAALLELVPDTKGDRTDADLIDDALNVAYSEHFPAWETADIGDGSDKEWTLGASPFGGWLMGYSSAFPLVVEQLDSSGDPQNPTELRLDWDIVDRYESSVAVKVLRFEGAPSATSQVRVRWTTKWAAADVPEAHQMAVVYLGCELKSRALAAHYRKTVDAGSDVFDGFEVAEGYKTDAEDWRKKALASLGMGGSPGPSTKRFKAQPRRRCVFNRGGP